MGRNAIGRLFKAPPSGGLLRKAATLLCAALAVNTATEAQSTTFNYTGSSQTYTATSTGTLVIDMAGAKGGNKYSSGPSYGPLTQVGGAGGRVVCSLAVTAGQVLNIYVGGQGQTPTSYISSASGGFNGGGNSGNCGGCGGENHTGGGGGGATDIRIGGTALSNRVVVAGGGGGAGFQGNPINYERGGIGGGLTGGPGYNFNNPVNNGGSQSAGGTGYSGAPSGTLGTGGSSDLNDLGGGGGGGYYGGGSGDYTGGGGGSSFTHATLCTGVTHTQGYQAGNGYVTITPLAPACSTPAAIGGPSAVCVGNTVTLTNDTTGGTWSSASTSIASVNTSGVVTGNAAGTTTISYSKGTGCTVTKTITVNALPTNTIASFTPQPSIAGLPISFTVSNTSLSSYSWNFGDATSSSTMNPTKAYATSGTFIPTLTVTNSNGCSSSDTAVVVVSPVPPITGYLPPLCSADAPDTLSITVPGGTWSSSNTAVAVVGSSTGILTYVNVGTATITYHFGAGLFTTISVTAGNSPNPIFGPSTTCMGSNTGLYMTPYGSAGAWTSSTTSVATIGTGTGICSAVSLGTTTITWTNSWGCYVTRTQTVVASPAAITGPSFLCSGDTATYMNDTLGGTWSSTNSGVVSINASTGLATGSAAGTATLSYTIAYGCASTKLVNGGALPAAITGGLLLCPGGTSALSCTTPGGSWTTSDGSVATVSGGVVTAMATGTANITYTITSGCRRVVTVTVNAAPGANTGTAELCVGGSTTLSNATTGGTWSSGTTSVATVGSSSGVVTGIATGNANITYTVSGAGCYSATTVTVNGATGAITGTLNACVGDTSVLSHGTTGGTWSSSNTSMATVDATSGAVIGVSAGTPTITYFITSSCYVTTSFTVKVLPTAISGTQSVCVGSTTALASGPTGGTWTSSSTTTASVNASTGLVSGVAAGMSTISYSISNGCRRTAVVTVNAVPASITGPSGTCVGASATLASTTSGGSWSSSNTTVATIDGTTGVVSGLVTGTTMISYTLSTGCRATRVMSVVAAPAAISGTATLCAGSATTLSSTTGGGTWSSSDISIATTGTATGTSTVVSGVSTGNATISYTVGGCSTTRVVTVTASPGTISGPTALCVGNSNTYSISGTGGTWVSSTSRVTIGSTTGIAAAITAGTNTISYRVSATCYSTLPVTVTATPASITGTARVCIGYTTVLGHPVSGGTWSGSSSVASIADSAGFGVVTGSIAGTGTITYTLPSGCYKTVVVTVNSNPATPSGGTSPICVGTTTNLTASPAGGTWLSSTTAVGTVGNTTGVVMGVSAGTTTISYRMTATGCFSTKEVTVNPLPGMIVGSSTVCVGGTTTLSDTTGGGGLWTMTPTTVGTVGGSTGTVSGVVAGAATVTYTLSTGCRRTRSMTVLASPTAITGNLTLCVGNTTTLGSSPAGLTWSSSDASIAPVSTGGVVSGYATGMATISYTNASGCSRTAVVTVNAALPANTSSTGAMNVCQGTTITLSNIVSGGTWSSASSAIASVGSGTGIVTGATVGSTNITYALGTGCRSISSVAVNAAAPAITGTSSVCEGSTVTFTSTGSGTWESANSSIATVGGGAGIAVPGGPTTVVTGVTAGSTVITYTMPSGCFSTKSILVKVTPVISALSIMTVGDTLTALSSVSGGTWSSSAGGVAGVISTTGFITAVSAGSATISFTASSTGCVGSWGIDVIDSGMSKPGIITTTASEFSIYPNPTVGSVTINTTVAGRMTVMTIDGRTAGSYELTAGANAIQLSSDLAAGVYMCQFIGTDGSTQQVRMVLQR
jgi:trimeric autotransporter adhesin